MSSYNITAPDGSNYKVDADSDAQAQTAIQSVISSHPALKNPPSEGSVMSFFRGIGNNLPLGPQFAALASKGSYSGNMAAQNTAVAQDKANHPVAYGAGAVGGTLGPAAIPGVGELMAANPATAGAFLGGTNAISNTDIQKQPLKALKDGTEGAATGALVSGLIGKLMPAVGSKAEEMANNRANASVNMPKNILVDMTPAERQAQGAALRAGGVVNSDKQEALDKASALLKGYGQTIGSIGKGAEAKGLSIDDPNEITQPLIEKFSKYGQSSTPEYKQLANTYLAAVKDINNLATPEIAEGTPAVRMLDATGKEMPLPPSPSEPITWSKLQGLKKTYGDMAFKSTGEIKNQAAADTYFALSDSLKGIADKAANNPSIPSQYRQALAGYSQMSPVVDGLTSAVDTNLRGAGGTSMALHPMRALASMPRGVRLALGSVATAAGHPLVGIGGGLLPEVLNPAVQSNFLGGLAKASPDIQNGLAQLATKVATNPEAKAKMNDLVDQLKKKFKDGGSF